MKFNLKSTTHRFIIIMMLFVMVSFPILAVVGIVTAKYFMGDNSGDFGNGGKIFVPVGIHDGSDNKDSKLHKGEVKGVKVSAKLGSDQIYYKDGKTYLLVTIEGQELPGLQYDRERLPTNISIVIDRSGSMSGQKLDNVKDALERTADMFNSSDRVSLVVYDDTVQTVYESRHFDKESYLSAIKRIHSGSSTYLEGGLREGLDNVQDGDTNEYINRVILLSDGLANVGISDADQLARIVEREAGSDSRGNIVVSTIGVGADYDEDLMSQVAIAGNGGYYFMESPSQAEEIFAEEFDSIFGTMATDIKVEFNLDNDFKVVRGVGYDLENSNHFEPLDIYSSKVSSYLFEIEADKDLRKGDEKQISEITVSFTDPWTEEREEINLDIDIEVVGDEINPLADDEVYYQFITGFNADQSWIIYEALGENDNDLARETIDELVDIMNQANQRLDGDFDDEVKVLEERQDYMVNLRDEYVNESENGRVFQKDNQSESFDLKYKK